MQKKRAKGFLTLTLVVIVGLLAVNLVTHTVNAFNRPREHFAEVVVHSNDTLWSIAEQFTPAGQDIRATVYMIRKTNHLSSAQIQPGQRLLIPGF